MNDASVSGIERRKDPRHPLLLQVTYQNSAAFLTSWTENISAGGFFFPTDRTFEIGQELRIKLAFPGLLESFEVTATVAWIRAAGPDKPSGIGVRVDSDFGRRQLARLALMAEQERKPETTAKRPFRVLVVEDNEYSKKACERVLSQVSSHSAIEVVYASNGHEALAMVQSEPPDLVITDIYMPIMDGLTFIRKLREDPKSSDLTVIVVTAGGRDEREMLGTLKIHAFLEKPFKFGQLFETIIYLYHLRSAAEQE